jgi:hypothetical protein
VGDTLRSPAGHDRNSDCDRNFISLLGRSHYSLRERGVRHFKLRFVYGCVNKMAVLSGLRPKYVGSVVDWDQLEATSGEETD